jgi:hypothetical protein
MTFAVSKACNWIKALVDKKTLHVVSFCTKKKARSAVVTLRKRAEKNHNPDPLGLRGQKVGGCEAYTGRRGRDRDSLIRERGELKKYRPVIFFTK